MKKLLFILFFLFYHTLSFAPNTKSGKEKQDITQCSLFENILNVTSSLPNFDINRIPILSPIDTVPYVWLSSKFGYRKHPKLLLKMFHEGIDIAAPVGTNVFATGRGYVEEIGYMKQGYGNYIIINHLNDYKTRYAHLKHINVEERQVVDQGTVIATSGNTGTSTGPHLHYEIIKNNEVIDPIGLINTNEFEYLSTLKNIQNVIDLYKIIL